MQLTATVIAADGTGLRGLSLRFSADGTSLPAARPCGAGCYAVDGAAALAREEGARSSLGGKGRPASSVSFALPAHWPVSANALLRGAERAFKALRSVVYRERLSSGPRVTITSVWRTEAPDRLSYRSSAGDAGVIIGRKRWDLVVGGGWKEGPQNPPLDLPAPPWGAGAYDVTLLGGGRLAGGRSCASRCSSRRRRPGTRSRSTGARCARW